MASEDLPQRVAMGFAKFVVVMAALYLFLIGLGIMGDAFKVLTGDSTGGLFEAVNNPIAGLCIGILVTVLLQSSSTSTSIVVTMVGAGLLDVTQAVPIIMGANIGTSVTNTLVSLGFAADKEQYTRGFAGATVHDMFNYLNVLLLLPLEIIVNAISGKGGILEMITFAMTDGLRVDKGDKWEGPIKKVVGPVTKYFLEVDKDVIKDHSQGKPSGEMCAGGTLYDLCADFDNSGCNGYKFNVKAGSRCDDAAASGLATCSSKKATFDFCLANSADAVNQTVLDAAVSYYDEANILKGGVFYDGDVDSDTAGAVMLVVSIIVTLAALFAIVKTLQFIVQGEAEQILKKALNMNDYLAIFVGAGVTLLVQSSSITTSTLTPLVAIGALELEKMLPLTLGANIGTTGTGLLASLVSGSAASVQVALCHLFFNIFGILIWFPIPAVRAIPLNAARWLGKWAGDFKSFPILYVLVAFALYPLTVLGLSIMMSSGEGGLIAGGVVLLLVIIALHAAFFYWWHRLDGATTFKDWVGIDEEEAEKIMANNA